MYFTDVLYQAEGVTFDSYFVSYFYHGLLESIVLPYVFLLFIPLI